MDLRAEKINLPCTLAGLYFIYQFWECLPSVVLEPQIIWYCCPRPAVTSFCTAQEKKRGQEQITPEVLSIKYIVLFLQYFISYPDTNV